MVLKFLVFWTHSVHLLKACITESRFQRVSLGCSEVGPQNLHFGEDNTPIFLPYPQ